MPGILAFDDVSKIFGFAEHSGVYVPLSLTKELEKSARTNLSVAHSLSVLLDLWLRLSAEGVDRYHIYTLNKAQPTQTLLELLGIPKHPDALSSCYNQTIMS
jgi:methylenetetrahydrofolate reductase (NADPH)